MDESDGDEREEEKDGDCNEINIQMLTNLAEIEVDNKENLLEEKVISIELKISPSKKRPIHTQPAQSKASEIPINKLRRKREDFEKEDKLVKIPKNFSNSLWIFSSVEKIK